MDTNEKNDLSKSEYSSAKVALATYKEKLAEKNDELVVIRDDNLKKEADILILQTQLSDMKSQIQQKDMLIKNLGFKSTNKSPDTKTEHYEISDVNLTKILK